MDGRRAARRRRNELGTLTSSGPRAPAPTMKTLLLTACGRAAALGLLLAPALHAQTTLYGLPGPKALAQAGSNVAGVGDIDRDGVPDFLVGMPGYALVASFVPGRAVLYSGRTGEPIYTLLGLNHAEQFGASLSAGIDFDGDGWLDFFVGAPNYQNAKGRVALYSGRTGGVITQWTGLHEGSLFGSAITIVGKVDGGARDDFAISAPYENFAGINGQGRVRIYAGEHLGLIRETSPATHHANSGFGLALAGNCDWNNDGVADLIVGAPYAGIPGYVNQFNGMVSVVSGVTGGILHATYGQSQSFLGTSVAGLGPIQGFGAFAAGAPYDGTGGSQAGKVRVHSLDNGSVPIYELVGAPGSRFGWSLASVVDIDGLGRRGFLVGAPRQSGLLLGTIGRASLHRASDGELLEAVAGMHADGEFGFALASVGDLNGDGRDDFVVGAPRVDEPELDNGHARVILSRGTNPVTYGTAKTNSLGCVPVIGYSGAPSLSVGDNFRIRATNVRSDTAGVFLYGFVPANTPFGGGTLLVGAPVIRGGVQNSGGTPGGVDCSGTYSKDFGHAAMQAAGLVPGVNVYCQFWSRDPGFPEPGNIGLTGGLRFEVLP